MNMKMDFFKAVLTHDQDTLNSLLPRLTTELQLYLQRHYQADPPDAQDAVQSALLYVIEKIHSQSLHTPEAALKYLYLTSRHRYLRTIYQSKKLVFMTNERQEPFVNDSQVDTLILLEERGVLEECIAKLNVESQRFVRALLQSPPPSTEALAREFGCRETTIWVRKHRLTALLAQCVEGSM